MERSQVVIQLYFKCCCYITMVYIYFIFLNINNPHKGYFFAILALDWKVVNIYLFFDLNWNLKSLLVPFFPFQFQISNWCVVIFYYQFPTGQIKVQCNQLFNLCLLLTTYNIDLFVDDYVHNISSILKCVYHSLLSIVLEAIHLQGKYIW